VFHGGVPLAELQAFLREHRPTCVLPSIVAADGQVEGIPVTLVEAMANGAPVVSTRSGSIETLVVPGTGTLVDPGDEAALAAALLDVIAAPEAAHTRCLAAADRLLGEFDLEHTAARIAELTGVPTASRKG
jgi:colanic acid/amylovoran biosynthesis glycosyltransferase